MTDYHVTLVRSPDITPEAHRRQLHAAFSLLLDWADETADGVGDPGRESAPSVVARPAPQDGSARAHDTLSAEMAQIAGGGQ